jgi:hypothetical protein
MIVSHRNQEGSALSSLLIVAVLAYGVFIAIQYVPLHVESSTVDSVLSSIQGSHKAQPITNVQEAERKIDVLLNVNEIRDMKEYFKVSDYRGEILIDVTYNRDLNLLFQTRTIRYEKSLVLPRPP